MESLFVWGNLISFVELELAFEASIVSLRFFDNVCQALKEIIKSAKERSSRRVAEQFRDVVPYRPKLQNLKDAEGKNKKRYK
uniref:Uncharacterized protein n=1 Tax=Solanum tuberosum TaxID=4113 RepID=M1DPU1_SOLTU